MKKKPFAKISCWAKGLGISEACRMLKKKKAQWMPGSRCIVFSSYAQFLIFSSSSGKNDVKE